MRAAFELASETFGPPRLLVSNALYQYPDLIVRVPVAEWERVLGVIATGTFIGTESSAASSWSVVSRVARSPTSPR